VDFVRAKRLCAPLTFLSWPNRDFQLWIQTNPLVVFYFWRILTYCIPSRLNLTYCVAGETVSPLVSNPVIGFYKQDKNSTLQTWNWTEGIPPPLPPPLPLPPTRRSSSKTAFCRFFAWLSRATLNNVYSAEPVTGGLSIRCHCLRCVGKSHEWPK
jgi:hypothetical protein